MSTKNGKTRIAAIADLHVQKSVAEAPFRELFAEVSNHADILALCGDLTNSGLPEEAESLVKNLKACKVPVVAVLGNHDYHSGRVEEVKKVLAEGKLALLDGQGCEVKGVGFAGTKGFGGGFGERMLSSFGEEAIKGFVAEAVNESVKLESGLGSLTSHHKIVLLHYSPISQTVEGEPVEIYPFLGCSRLADTIDRFEVAAVFHGHAHRGTEHGTTTKGAAVYNCCLEMLRSKDPKRPWVVVEV